MKPAAPDTRSRFLRRCWPSTIRYQLICGVAVVHLLLMTLFVFDLVERQREFLKEQSLQQTRALVQNLAVNSSSWVLANDVVGLEEIVQSLRRLPGIRYAMVVAGDGKILAHTDASRVGMTLNDPVSAAMLAARPELRTLHLDGALLDLATPILAADGEPVGWARIGQDQEEITKNLKLVSRNGILYTLLAIAVGSALAILIGNRLTSGLNRMLDTVGQIREGRRDIRMETTHHDEISRLAEGVNLMLDSMIDGEIKLRRSADEIHDLYDHAPCGYHSLNTDGIVVRINATELQWLGYLPEEVIGRMHYAELLADSSVPVFRERFAALQQGGSYHDVELTLLRKDGSHLTVLASASAFTDDAGAFVMSRATVYDISDRLRAEAELRRVRNYLANIIDSMPAVLVGITADGTVSQWNRQAETITGITGAEALGRPVTQVLPEFSPWITLSDRDEPGSRFASQEKILLNKNGQRRFYDLMLYPLVANCVEGTVIRIDDVTEQALVQELMIQTEKMMSVGGLAAGMAHEINNPLGIISQSAQNIERRVSPELAANRQAAGELGLSLDLLHDYFQRRQISQFLTSIREASARASRIVTNMLQFSRKSETIRYPVSLSELVDRTIDLAASDYDLKKKYDFRSIGIVREYDPDLPDVPVVTVEIEQVVLNLLKNAAQAMAANPSGQKPELRIRVRRDNGHAVLEVTDNGPGMDEKVRARVFEPFFTTKEPGVGTGLGLSVSYLIVTGNHQGMMTVESAPDGGACFTVKLPLQPDRGVNNVFPFNHTGAV